MNSCRRFIKDVKKGFGLLFSSGPNRVKKALKGRFYRRFFDYSVITDKVRQSEESTVFDRNIKFSILVPLYNTPIRYLHEMIASVQAQTYKNWELCLADGSDDEHAEVGKVVKEIADRDSRIVYKKLSKNLGISENTNECITMATGDYIALFDHDDILHPSVLFENMQVICREDADFIYTDEATFEGNNIKKIIVFHFKPDFAPDNLRANNYICHFSVFSRQLLEKSGIFRSEFDGSQDHDLILRLTENAKKVCHIPKLLYFWRSHKGSVAQDISSKTYAITAGRNAVGSAVERMGMNATVESTAVVPTIYRIKYELTSEPKVTIIIPNKDHTADLKRCVQSILDKSTYRNFEVLIIENNSVESEIFEYYEELKKLKNVKVLTYDGEFNYSKINNLAAGKADGEYIVFLNNDTEIIADNWLEELLMYAEREDVGAVGAKLYFNDNTVQHGGVIIDFSPSKIAGHSHYKELRENPGYMGKMYYAQNVSAVTAACMMVKKELFFNVGGFDEEFKVAFNDVDLCMKLRDSSKLIVFNPYCELYHYESKSRGLEQTAEQKARFDSECELFREKWGCVLAKGDPYYNPNFSHLESYLINYRQINSDRRK